MLGLLAHALHLALVLVGLVGLVVLLGPGLRRDADPADEHERRVAALRTAIAQGTLTTAPPRPAAPPSYDVASWRAVAVTSSMAAAIVHAAVAPHHFEENLLVGLFFVVVALWQAWWSWQVAHEATGSRLLYGVLGSLALVALWAWSRTTGLPFGFTDGAEPVGAWDLAAVTWQLVVVGACLAGRHAPRRRTVMGRPGAGPLVWAGASAVALLVLSFTANVH